MKPKLTEIVEQLKSNNRLALARAITLVESEQEQDQLVADELLEAIKDIEGKSFRIAISGSPGAGKSTLIDVLGLEFIKLGYKVAVLAIDPSSEISRGSILGDKTRMEDLSRSEDAFIRPSASRGFLGGIGVATRDAIQLCEVAGYQIILVETVGVGQSETLAAELVDYFIYVAIPGAGDDLQGIKKGVLEHTDLVLVNKSEGNNKTAAEVAQKQYQSSLKILRGQDVSVLLVSALQKTGVEALAKQLQQTWREQASQLVQRREKQEHFWIKVYFESFLRIKMSKMWEQHKALGKTSSSHPTARQVARKILEKTFPRF